MLQIYHKFCLECIYPEEMKKIKIYAEKNKHKIYTYKTSTDYQLHQTAAKMIGTENYKAFVVEDSKDPTEINEFIGKIVEKPKLKNKPVKKTKKGALNGRKTK